MKEVLYIFIISTICYASATGGWKTLDVSDTETNAYAEASLQELDLASNSLYKSKLLELKDAKVQVVAGLKYRFTYIKAETKCMTSEDECEIRENTKEECVVEMWVQPWLKNSQITASSCLPLKVANETKPLFGGDGHDLGSIGAFEGFKKKFNKKYSSETEEEMRFGIFRENMKIAQKMNEQELGTARYGATHLADITQEEFKKFFTSGQWNTDPDPFMEEAEIPNVTPPDAWDWREHNAVSPIKNQGSCGSCWAFSVTGNVEGQWAIQQGNLTSLSEQELVDCDKLDQGCNGGLPTNAYKEIMRLGGLESEKEYPYKAEDEKCVFDKEDANVKISGAVNISSNEEDMKAWLYKNGPISIGINALAMQFYIGGVAHPWKIMCSPDYLDHGVLIVGYGVKQGWFHDKPYWIIKNSWGTWWGEKGYYLLYRGAGVCGVNRMCSSAVV